MAATYQLRLNTPCTQRLPTLGLGRWGCPLDTQTAPALPQGCAGTGCGWRLGARPQEAQTQLLGP